jgi:hypothetical protein
MTLRILFCCYTARRCRWRGWPLREWRNPQCGTCWAMAYWCLRASLAKSGGVARLGTSLGVGRQLGFHLRLADVAKRLRLPPERAARHLEAAQQLRPAREEWVAAADKACARGDHRRALGFICRALAIWPWTEQAEDRLRVLEEQARCAAHAGDLPYAAAAWEEIAEFSPEANRSLAAYGPGPICISCTGRPLLPLAVTTRCARCGARPRTCTTCCLPCYLPEGIITTTG